MKYYTQEFNPPIKIFTGEKEEPVMVEERLWNPNDKASISKHKQDMGYMGQYQIQEVWKRYGKYKELYVSNYGYVAEIKEKEARAVFQEKFDNFNKDGVSRNEMQDNQRELLKKNICDLKNIAVSSSISILVCLAYKSIQIHRMVAESFLNQPDGANTVHHIDNNSYNNNVTNLIWLTKAEHDRDKFKANHPMS